MTFALKDKGFPYSIASKLKIKHNFTKQLIYPARLGMSSYKNEKKKKKKELQKRAIEPSDRLLYRKPSY